MPEPPKRTCVRIEYEYSDGEIRRAVGDAAEEINGAIADAFLIKQVHGDRYRGPVMQVVRPARTEEQADA